MKLPLKTAKALVEAWGDDRISVCILAVRLSEVAPDAKIEDWDALYASIGLPPKTFGAQSVRKWVASYFVNATNELWAKHPNKATKWMVSGLDYGASTRPPARAKREFMKEAGYKAVRMRDLSKKHDWNTCK